MKYTSWQRAPQSAEAAAGLVAAGFDELTAHVLAVRGLRDPAAAAEFLRGVTPRDPFALRDMDKAVARIRRALDGGEHMAVYGDYDVDGITSIALLTRYLQSRGGHVSHYVPDRFEEGYGLHIAALRRLCDEGVRLVVTVDAGVAAIAEAQETIDMGLDLIITDHHQCRDTLPRAVAVIDPCRADCGYPFAQLAGVGVAFKLVCALAGADREQEMLDLYGDLVALGTVADVMPLVDENRFLVRRGLERLAAGGNENRNRNGNGIGNGNGNVGLRALMAEADLHGKRATSITLGYLLAPRINAAGRLGKTSLAVELLLTDDPARAGQLAAELCSLNLLRQTLENETCLEALEMLRDRADDSAIVLASEQWRPGVIGIVASRLVERFDAPVFLICLDKGKGRGSARSARGVRLVDALTQCADLLGNYGGHDMAAGFTIMPDDIEPFRQRVRDYIDRHMAPREEQTLCVDAAVPPALFTHRRVTSLQSMEPFGPGNPQPVFMLEGVTLTKAAPVGGGRHMRLSFLAEGMAFAGIFFGVDAISLGLVEGDCVDIAFSPEINTFANRSRVQFNLCDMRLSSPARELEAESLTLYRRFRAGDGDLSPAERRALSPSRSHLGAVWRYCARMAVPHHLTGHVTGHVGALSRKISREAGLPLAPGQLRAALDIFAELGLLGQTVDGETVTIEPVAEPDKVDLEDSETYRNLRVLTVR